MSEAIITRRGGGSSIKSIQRGTATILAGASSVTIPITSVVTTNSIAFLTETSTQNPAIAKCKAYVIMDGSTQIRAVLSTAVQADTTETVYWQVIEYNNVLSLQRGTSAFADSTNTFVTITAVILAKTILHATHNTTSTFASGGICGSSLITTTSLFINSPGAGNLSWQIIQFR